jgi:mono/diheme cytochrome c family protein
MLPTRPESIRRSTRQAPRWAWLGALLGVAAFAQTPVPKSVNALKAFYQQNCVRCHGADGSAKDPEGHRLGGLDFTKAAREFKTADGPAADREIRTMVRVIQKGLMFGFSMPAWKDKLSQDEATLLVKEVLLKTEAGKPIQPDPEPTPSK